LYDFSFYCEILQLSGGHVQGKGIAGMAPDLSYNTRSERLNFSGMKGK